MKLKQLIFPLLVLTANCSFAQKTLFDLEPNNEPKTAQTFSGEHQLSGSLTDQDQDLYLWDLSDAAADFFWDLELTGVPGRLTQLDVMQLEFTEDRQGVTQKQTLLTLRHFDGLGAVNKNDLVFSPGEYYIGLSFADDPTFKPVNNPLGNAFSGLDNNAAEEIKLADAGVRIEAQSDYKLVFKKQKKIYPIRFHKDINQPVFVTKNTQRGLLMTPEPQWLSFKINENEAINHWQISGRASLKNNIGLILYDSEKNQLADTTADSEGFYSFDGLNLPVGEYLIKIQSKTPNNMASILIQDTGVHVEGSEIEPNNYLKTANQLTWETALTGQRNNDKDRDYFEFDVVPEQSTNNTLIEVKNPSQTSIEFCLKDHSGENLKCVEEATDMQMNDLVLTTGTYYVSIYRGAVNTNYELKISDLGKRQQIQEAEPNDRFNHAAVMTEKRMVKGQFEGNEFDFYKFSATEKPQMWTIQAIGTNVRDIQLYNAAGSSVQSMSYPEGNKRARLSNLFLMPGTHFISVRGASGKYLLRAFPTGEPDPNFEFEPNDDTSRSMSLKFGDHKKGMLSEDRDKDIYHFSLANKEYIQLKLKPPVDGSVRYILSWFNNNIADKTSQQGQQLTFEGLLKAGDYQVDLRPAGGFTSDAAYSIQLNRLPRYSCASDCEPNDSFQQANQIKQKSFIKGSHKTHGDEDWYQLPPFELDTKLTFKNHFPDNSQYLRVYDYQAETGLELKGKKEPDQSLTSFVVPAGVSPNIRIYGADVEYNYSLLVNDVPTSEWVTKDSGVSLQLTAIAEQVAAYHSYAQQLDGVLKLKNNTAETKKLKLIASAADFKWQLLGLPETITLEANQQASVPFKVWVAKHTNGLQSVRLSFAAIDDADRVSEVWQDIQVSGLAAAVAPVLDLSLPEPLQGGINLAAEYFGSQLLFSESEKLKQAGRGYQSLFNGYGFDGYGMIYRKPDRSKNDFISIKLAGENPMDVVGLVLNPASDSNYNNYLQDFEFQLSMDGVQFQTVLKNRLEAIGIEQAFELPQKTPAKYARLVLLSNTSNALRPNIGLGEWKVIADPKQNFNTLSGFNLADPELGGYVAWSDPQQTGNWNIDLLKSDDKKKYVRSQNNNIWQWVIGFHNQRAAKINRIHWQKPDVSPDDTQTFDQVTVSVANESPTGPWQIVGTYDLLQLENIITLNDPIWARYVKFSVGNVKPKAYRYPPDYIKIFEVPVNQQYASILGEWGELSQQAIYEKTIQTLSSHNHQPSVNNNSKSSAQVLAAATPIRGQVQLEQANKPDWYKYQVPTGQNTLKITLSGNPTVSTVLAVEDQLGLEVPYTKDTSKMGQVIYQATVEPGNNYFIKVEEPPRSVVFSWDTSGSTSKYHAIIFQALSQFTEGVIPDRDTVNFLPFGGNLLMDKWYGEPYLLKTILNNYSRKDNSSHAEKTLLDATKALANRQGSKSIVLITDALTGSDQNLWQHLRDVKPRIFSMGLIAGSSGKSHEVQFDLMQSWSRVNNGEFNKIVSNAELEVAFDKAVTKLRQPADYSIQVDAEFLAAPGPGSLIITEALQNQSTAVELILDASGSMLKQLNGERRINIAKNVLIKTVTEVIPADTLVALRVFGDQQANACRTDLRLPLEPLDAAKAKSTIEKVNAKNLAKTPIADSLSQVASDLKNHQGKKIIILITDGEETCDGDPAKVINELTEKGIDIRLNIVGFAINDDELKAEFNQWSKQGNGKYFDSNDPSSLSQAIDEALQTPYAVYSLTGELLAEGTVNGEPLQLPAGFYEIKVYGNEVITHSQYQIKGEVEQQIIL